MRRGFAFAAAMLAVVLGAGPVWAHVTVQPNEAATGAFARFVVRVPNERGDADTTKVEVELPPLAFVSFQPKAGWTRTVEMVTLDEPLDVFGEEVSEVPGKVTWAGGTIKPGEFDEFGFSARTPDDAGSLEFPALQTYSSGEVVRWIGPEDSEEPAGLVQVIALPEGQGQLSLLASLAAGGGGSTGDGEEAEEESDDTLPLTLGIAGTGFGLLALVLTLVKKRA